MPDNTTRVGIETQITQPDGTLHKTLFGSSTPTYHWSLGLPLASGTFDSNGVRQRWTTTNWTQDMLDTSVPLNPIVTETNVGDPAGNRARSRIEYEAFNLPDGTYGHLPSDVYDYKANATTVMRRTHLQYNLATAYASRRIIGLPSDKSLYQVDPNTLAETLMS
jgi:hypothetical protein